MENKLKEIQSDRDRRYIIGKIEAYLTRIFELDDKKPIAEHLVTILRSKGDSSPPYTWKNDVLLGKMEAYYKEFRNLKEEEYDGDTDN